MDGAGTPKFKPTTPPSSAKLPTLHQPDWNGAKAPISDSQDTRSITVHLLNGEDIVFRYTPCTFHPDIHFCMCLFNALKTHITRQNGVPQSDIRLFYNEGRTADVPLTTTTFREIPATDALEL